MIQGISPSCGADISHGTRVRQSEFLAGLGGRWGPMPSGWRFPRFGGWPSRMGARPLNRASSGNDGAGGGNRRIIGRDFQFPAAGV